MIKHNWEKDFFHLVKYWDLILDATNCHLIPLIITHITSYIPTSLIRPSVYTLFKLIFQILMNPFLTNYIIRLIENPELIIQDFWKKTKKTECFAVNWKDYFIQMNPELFFPEHIISKVRDELKPKTEIIHESIFMIE